MAWDLRAALLKKGEVESARLADFDFRLRARTMRKLAARLDIDPATLVARIAEQDDATILASLPAPHPETLAALFQSCQAEARAEIIAERGDPTPHRLA